MKIAIVGAGINGVTAAVELAERGHTVSLLDPGPLPHPLAATTDISKVVRMEYGADEDYMALAEQALAGWHAWNREFGQDLYHQTGVIYLRLGEMSRGTYEWHSWRLLNKRKHNPQRLDVPEIKKDGFYRLGRSTILPALDSSSKSKSCYKLLTNFHTLG